MLKKKEEREQAKLLNQFQVGQILPWNYFKASEWDWSLSAVPKGITSTYVIEVWSVLTSL